MTTRRRTCNKLTARLGSVVLACLLGGCTVEQILIGQWYAIETDPAGVCPRLQWRFVVNPQRTIQGFLSSNWHQIGVLSGQLAPDDSFQMTLTDASGSPTANVTGRFTSQVSTLSIHGAGAGSACDGQTFQLRLGGYFARQGGGGGGGGG